MLASSVPLRTVECSAHQAVVKQGRKEMFYGVSRVSKSHLFLKVYNQCFMRFLYFV